MEELDDTQNDPFYGNAHRIGSRKRTKPNSSVTRTSGFVEPTHTKNEASSTELKSVAGLSYRPKSSVFDDPGIMFNNLQILL